MAFLQESPNDIRSTQLAVRGEPFSSATTLDHAAISPIALLFLRLLKA
jgi:hypothetical protein